MKILLVTGTGDGSKSIEEEPCMVEVIRFSVKVSGFSRQIYRFSVKSILGYTEHCNRCRVFRHQRF